MKTSSLTGNAKVRICNLADKKVEDVEKEVKKDEYEKNETDNNLKRSRGTTDPTFMDVAAKTKVIFESIYKSKPDHDNSYFETVAGPGLTGITNIGNRY